MTRQFYRRLIFYSQLLTVLGLGLSALWNVVGQLLRLPALGWWSLAVPLPGLFLWSGALAAPRLLSKTRPSTGRAYRLVYAAPAGWSDRAARQALANLARSAGGLTLTWARDGEGIGCWLSVPAYDEVLDRLIGDIFPAGQLEIESPPEPTPGVVLLQCQETPPAPADLCQLNGIDGVYLHWQSPQKATAAIWGPQAETVAQQFARPADLWPGVGPALKQPPFSGTNPWPELPPFPVSEGNPALEAVSHFTRLAPALRVEPSALVLGLDEENQPVGFELPDLEQAKVIWLLGREAGSVVTDLAGQAIRARLPLFFLDGDGTPAARLAQRTIGQAAAGRVLLCDLERPAQSPFRLNPLWLPADADRWPPTLAYWQGWLKELGVTPGGLGQTACSHTLAAVTLTALAAAERALVLDLPGLADALETPDFLTQLATDQTRSILEPSLAEWWDEQGRHTPNFDAQLRLGHLRERLQALLTLPEYSLLWRGPFLDPAAIFSERITLLWRLPHSSGRLRPFLTSQLLALVTALTVQPPDKPVLVILNEIQPGPWAETLAALPNVRLILAARKLTALPAQPRPSALILTRLDKEEAEVLQTRVPGARPVDLRRLPSARLIFRAGGHLTTATLLDSTDQI